MQNSSWVALLKRVPPELHNKLMLVTTNGNEINLQVVYRIEEDFIVLRGRLAGTMEAGSLLFIPFNQINYVGFREEIKEAQVDAMFSGSGAPAVVVPREPEPPKPHPAEPTTIAPTAPPTTSATPTPTTSPGKAALLERLRRSRAGQDSKHD